MSLLLHLGKPSSSGGLTVECHPWAYQMSYMFPQALVPLVLSNFLAGHVTGQFRILILVAPCWMEAPCLSTAHNILAEIPHWCPMVKDLVRDVSVSRMLKGLQSLHLTLLLFRDVFYADRGSSLPSVRWV